MFVAIGGGGLISGVAAYIKSVRPEIKVIGVQMNDSDAMLRSVRAGKRVTLADVGLFADGTAVKLVGEETFRLARQLVDDFVVVDTDAVCAAIRTFPGHAQHPRAGRRAVGVAAAKQYAERTSSSGETFVAITSGANMNFDRLRFVAERAEVGEQREAIWRRHHPRGRGSFRRFCEPGRAARRHRVQLPHLRRGAGARVRRRGDRQPDEEADKLARNFERHGFPASTSPTTNSPSCTCATWSAGAASWRRTSACSASSSPSGPAR